MALDRNETSEVKDPILIRALGTLPLAEVPAFRSSAS